MPIIGGSAMEFETKKQRSNYFRSVNTIINDGPAARPEWAKVPITFTSGVARILPQGMPQDKILYIQFGSTNI
jgi:hypothetical protein